MKIMVHIHNGINLTWKEKWNHKVCRKWMNLEKLILNGVTQTHKKKLHLFSLICVSELQILRWGNKTLWNYRYRKASKNHTWASKTLECRYYEVGNGIRCVSLGEWDSSSSPTWEEGKILIKKKKNGWGTYNKVIWQSLKKWYYIRFTLNYILMEVKPLWLTLIPTINCWKA